MLEQIIGKTIIPFVVATLAITYSKNANGEEKTVWRREGTFTQKNESSPTSKTVLRYELEHPLIIDAPNGKVLEVKVTKKTYDETTQTVTYTTNERERLYVGPDKSAYAAEGLLGLCGLITMGASQGEGVVIGAGLVEIGLAGGLALLTHSAVVNPRKKTKQTRETRISERNELIILSSTMRDYQPASNTPFTVSSAYFTYQEDLGAGTASGLYTNSQGNATIQLQPTDSGFAFSQEGLASIPYAQQLQKAGYPTERFMPLLQQYATPVQYTVTIQTKATDGENAKLDVPVDGFTVPPTAMQNIIMGL